MATVCNLVITVPLSVSLVLVLEAMARGSAFVTLRSSSSSSSKHSSCSDELIDDIDDIDVTSHDTDASCLLTKTAAGSVELMSSPEKVSLEEERQIIESENPRSLLVVGENKIELADLCGMFLGQRGKYSFIIIVRSVCVCLCVCVD